MNFFLWANVNNQELQINLEYTIPEKTTQTHGSQDQNANIEVEPTLHQKENKEQWMWICYQKQKRSEYITMTFIRDM